MTRTSNEPKEPLQARASLHRAALQQASLWLVMTAALLALFHSGDDSPLQSAADWQRIARVALPAVLVASYLEAATARSTRVAVRALGSGFAITLVLFVVLTPERIVSVAAPGDLARRALITLPVMSLFFAVPTWVRATYLEKRPTQETKARGSV
jgi:hypothetical protein